MEALLVLLPFAVGLVIVVRSYNAYWKHKQRMERVYKAFEEFSQSADNFEEAFNKDTLKNN